MCLHLSPLGHKQSSVSSHWPGTNRMGWDGRTQWAFSFVILYCRTWVFSLYLAPALATILLVWLQLGKKSRSIEAES